MSNKLTKGEFTAKFATAANLSNAEATRQLKALDELVQAELKAGNSLTILGGVLSTTTRAARKGHNPKTGESIQIDASVGVHFKPGSTLKEELNKK